MPDLTIPPTPLTPRESEILLLLCACIGRKEIASQCGISVSTVNTHLENIYKKWNVHTEAQAVIMALYSGAVRVEDAYMMMRAQ